MKIITFKTTKSSPYQIGIIDSSQKRIISLKSLGLGIKEMQELIMCYGRDLEQKLQGALDNRTGDIALNDIIPAAPIPHPAQEIICLGINYLDHAEESAKFKKEAFDGKREEAVYFGKRVNEATPDKGIVPSHKNITEKLDYEVELGVIIGKDAWNVKKEDAFDYVFGYTIINDISARDVQLKHKQWYFGKSLEGSSPMGPYIVTKDEFATPPIMQISSYVNGELRQKSSTDLLIFGIDYVIEELSRGMMLKAGSIISMGTPSGVGMGFEPPRFLKPGDVIECTIEGIGSLTNTIGE
ncbi:fumarylacetoacetate hydrolase family protein [Helicobacter cappadocius]|uniref:Fumarylacetoacetate hydrolase family protein n=1 Tax=Helicobacter cappadocius TaxID=3063998 RepID=A0AA90TE04_9HELI|nr:MULTISPECIES: fumarylacetoacetate hydrolase family protein [unclassified Helicobacter]MDO7252338.1 fumarylacetoacetate hydrolase family protein [Helicobacter sp. faydin-H75]MDP2538205.1 fumarylacetoacetate hydrolase family protein [Helicobacter sp. faydin-H76]